MGVGYATYVMHFFFSESAAFMKYLFCTTDFVLLTAVYNISSFDHASFTLIYFQF